MFLSLHVGLSMVWALRFMVSPLRLTYFDIMSNEKLMNLLVKSLPFQWASQFSELISQAPPSFQRKFSNLFATVASSEPPFQDTLISLSRVVFGLKNLAILRGQEIVYGIEGLTEGNAMGRLSKLSFFPKITPDHFKAWDALQNGIYYAGWGEVIENQVGSYRLLSTENLCGAITNKHVIGAECDDMWNIIDGECFRGLRDTKQVKMMVTTLLKPIYSDLNWVGPLVRSIHMIVALKYLEIVMRAPNFDDSLEIVTNIALSSFYEFELGLVYNKNPPTGPVKKLYSLMFDGLRGQVKFPGKPFEDLEGMHMLMKHLRELPISVEVIRAQINCIALLVTSRSVQCDVVIDETERLFKSTSFYNIPRRDVYSLFIFFSDSPQVAQYDRLRRLLWSYLVESADDIHDVLSVNRANFNFFAEYIFPDYADQLRDHISWDILRRITFHDMKLLIHYAAELNLPLSSCIETLMIRDSLRIILQKHFIHVGKYDGKPIYIPKLYLHPFVETIFWQLISIGLTFNMSFNFTLHHTYLTFLLSFNGTLKEKTMVEFVKFGVHMQFYDGGPVVGTAPEVFELDMLQISQSYHRPMIGNGKYDYLIYTSLLSAEARRADSHYTQQWRTCARTKACEEMRARLEFLATCVWRDRQPVPWYSDLLSKLSVTQFSRLVFGIESK